MSNETHLEEERTEQTVNDLLREMREKAESEKSEILSTADSKLHEIEERSRRECERVERDAVAEIEATLSAERDRVLGEVRSEARSQRLDLKHAEMKTVFDGAAADIESRIGGAEYAAALEALIRESLEFVGSGAEVFVSDDDLELCKKLVSSKKLACTVSAMTGKRGAIVASSSDGKRRVDNGLATRLARVHETLSADVAGILFG